jgi:hypothetical protein
MAMRGITQGLTADPESAGRPAIARPTGKLEIVLLVPPPVNGMGKTSQLVKLIC